MTIFGFRVIGAMSQKRSAIIGSLVAGEKYHPHYLYIPAHYIWREQGYVFIPGYWDYALKDRGAVYAPVKVNENDRGTITFEPATLLDPGAVLEILYPYYPDYLTVFQTYYHYNPGFWASAQVAPPYWDWKTWWTFAWQDQWALFWWWTHPSYPAPDWIDQSTANQIAKPNKKVDAMIKDLVPPSIVTSKGVVGSHTLFEAITKYTGKKVPIMPADPKQKEMIELSAKQVDPDKQMVWPNGNEGLIDGPRKPNFGPQKMSLPNAPKRVAVPPFPNFTAQVSQQPYQGSPPSRTQQQTQRNIPNRSKSNVQGQHHDETMIRSQPQRNPPSNPPIYEEPKLVP